MKNEAREFIVSLMDVVCSRRSWPEYVWQSAYNIVDGVMRNCSRDEPVVIGGKEYSSIFDHLPKANESDTFIENMTPDEALTYVKIIRRARSVECMAEDLIVNPTFETPEMIADRMLKRSSELEALKNRFEAINALLDVAAKYSTIKSSVVNYVGDLASLCLDAYGHIMLLSAEDYGSRLLDCKEVVNECAEKMKHAQYILDRSKATREETFARESTGVNSETDEKEMVSNPEPVSDAKIEASDSVESEEDAKDVTGDVSEAPEEDAGEPELEAIGEAQGDDSGVTDADTAPGDDEKELIGDNYEPKPTTASDWVDIHDPEVEKPISPAPGPTMISGEDDIELTDALMHGDVTDGMSAIGGSGIEFTK